MAKRARRRSHSRSSSSDRGADTGDPSLGQYVVFQDADGSWDFLPLRDYLVADPPPADIELISGLGEFISWAQAHLRLSEPRATPEALIDRLVRSAEPRAGSWP